MLNIANLHPKHFARVAAGQKQTEWRWRTRPDARLEAVRPGERIVLLECGTARAIFAEVRHVVRYDYLDGCLYAVRMTRGSLGSAGHVRKIQGWNRRMEL